MSILTPSDAGYDEARRSAVWNRLIPDNNPSVIVLAKTEEDVITAVTEAKAAGRQVSIRSGGHSWSGNHIREGATLIDLSAMDSIIEINREAKTAIVEPGAQGTEFLKALMAEDLFFPVGHCVGVGVGGFLLQGGFGWNSRVYGPACMSVTAIDVVTADGQLVRADENNHSDLFWAARGSGPGFFGVVTRFHLKVYDRPKAIVNCAYIYPTDVLEELFTWAHEIGPKVPVQMEMILLPHFSYDGGKEIPVAGATFADSEEEAREVAKILETSPVLDKAIIAMPYVPVEMDAFFGAVHFQYPDNHRWRPDNMWTHASAAELIPGVSEIVRTLPEDPSDTQNFSHLQWMNWQPNHPDSPKRPDMAFSSEDDIFLSAYGVWADPALDATHNKWAGDQMRAMEHLSTGTQLADENLAQRPAPFMTDENYARYDQIKAKYDPDNLFHTWWGRP